MQILKKQIKIENFLKQKIVKTENTRPITALTAVHRRVHRTGETKCHLKNTDKKDDDDGIVQD